jgi:hypothetical protein
MDLRMILLKALLIIAPPGNTKFSVAPDDCRSDECDGKTYSTFYGQHVHQETADEGKARYVPIVDAMVLAAELELCRDAEGNDLDDCTRNPKSKGWKLKELIAVAAGLAVAESGMREDVENGRGRAKHPDDAGGEGRGPAGEACFMQIHPRSVAAFVPDGDGSPESLIGFDQEHLVRCFRTGMRMLIHARAHCNWYMAPMLKVNPQYQYDQYYGMFSMYGSGQSCMYGNGVKTSYRTGLAYRVDKVCKQIAKSKADK